MKPARRTFLGAAAAGAAAADAPPLPLVEFGKHGISRLVVGGNPVSGNSHVSRALDAEMADYFTAANIKKMLRECEQGGINTWQSRGDRFILRMLREYRNEGGTIQWIAQTASELADIGRNIRDCAAAGAIGIYHHGALTDSLWRGGRIGEVLPRLKAMRDAGVRVGAGTHIPEVIDHIESEGWDADFYMTSLYNLGRTKEEIARLGGEAQGELFWEPDRERMLERVRKTSKQCLIFKVYAAARRAKSAADMRASLRQVFESAKPRDAVVIGMFPKHSPQVAENCRLVREALAPRPA
jgi:hypothetical protein